MLDQVKRNLLTTVHTNKQTTKLPRKAAKVNEALLASVDKRELVKGVRS